MPLNELRNARGLSQNQAASPIYAEEAAAELREIS
jgi:hypothetical protein